MAMVQPNTQIEEPLESEIDPTLQRELHQHPGKWVAMTRHKLLAVCDTPQEALRQAVEEYGVASPILYRVPTPDEAQAYFFV